MRIRKFSIFLFLIFFLIFLANFSFSETQLPKLPENLNQAKKLGEKFLKELQEILKKIWQKIGDWLENKIFPKIKTEIEKRKKIFQQELQKEKLNFYKFPFFKK